MDKSEVFKNWFKEEREKAREEGKIIAQKKTNKVLLSTISNERYKEAIEVIDSIEDLELLNDIFERASVHLKLMNDLEKLSKELNKEKETITNEELYELIIKSNKDLNKKIDSIRKKEE